MWSTVEVVDPIALSAKLVDTCDKHCHRHHKVLDVAGIPDSICKCFNDDLVLGDADRNVFVTLGLFTIIKIERNVQLLIPAIDFCVPTKECLAATEDNPCELFNSLRFPMDEFFPPQKSEFEDIEIPDNNHHHKC